ncbi:MAG: hypothetical protein IT495_05870 [Gammaproteobacteria bacterium]|nr:hypothetical protein [Gammaproteobacteria bacterium]
MSELLRTLIETLAASGALDQAAASARIIETHISLVLLTGRYAYEFKKPVNLGFVDFSTLERRAHYCREELSLNRRFAPQLYLGVVTITGTPDAPRCNGDGPVPEYAVRMRQFAQDALLGAVLARGEIGASRSTISSRRVP